MIMDILDLFLPFQVKIWQSKINPFFRIWQNNILEGVGNVQDKIINTYVDSIETTIQRGLMLDTGA